MDLMMQNLSPTWIEIDRLAIKKNITSIFKYKQSNAKVLAVLKANAYGLGVNEISNLLIQNGVDWIGVSTVQEAVELRQWYPQIHILILGPCFLDTIPMIVEHELRPVVYSYDYLEKLNQEALIQQKTINVHLMVDTGMGRIGVWYEKDFKFFKDIVSLKNIFVEGVCTHFSCADQNPDFTMMQIKRFNEFMTKLKLHGIHPLLKHVCNSSAFVKHPEVHYDMVRLGILIYGICPFGFQESLDIQPAVSLKTRVAFIKSVNKGRTISYGAEYICPNATKIATLPIGYSHAYSVNLSNKGSVLIHGVRCPVIGRVTMDQMMVDIKGVSSCQVGDEVVVIGKQLDQEITWNEVASMAHTIPYELLCNLSSRSRRIYLDATL